jgi:hypothetical protein
MFLDINGNSFSTLGDTNKAPVVNQLPNQIYGDNLLLWLDFTDKKTLFTNTACTTNVTAYGDYIRGIRDKSYRQKRLSASGDTITSWQWSSNTLNTLPCCLKTNTISGGTSLTFTHEDANFLSSNADYTVHFVCRFQQGGIVGAYLFTMGSGGIATGIGLNAVAQYASSINYNESGVVTQTLKVLPVPLVAWDLYNFNPFIDLISIDKLIDYQKFEFNSNLFKATVTKEDLIFSIQYNEILDTYVFLYVIEIMGDPCGVL